MASLKFERVTINELKKKSEEREFHRTMAIVNDEHQSFNLEIPYYT